MLTGEVAPWNVEWGSLRWVADARTDVLPPEVHLAPDEDLELELFYAAGQEEIALPRYLVALVDGEQVPFEGWGPSPVLQLEVGTSLLTRLRIASDRFPEDVARVDLFEIDGVHQAPEDANGNLIRPPNFQASLLASFEVIRP